MIVNVRPPDSRLPQALHELLEDDDKFGFLVMDGNGCLFGTLQGNNREILHKFTVDLPKKHGRGGQSALRFARLRLEKRHNYVRKVAELAVQFFITENKPNVAGIVLAGSADFKTELSTSDMFDPRLLRAVIKTVDVSYGAEPGFNQAIELSAETLGSVKLVQEKRLIQKYFDEISQDTGRYCFSVSDTLKGLELGAVETLIVWENLDVSRITVRNNSSGETKILHLSKVRQPRAMSSRRGMPAVIQPHQISLGSHAKWSLLPRRNALASQEQEKNESYFRDPETGVELEVSQLGMLGTPRAATPRAPQPQLIAIALWLQVIEKITLVEWFANMYKSFGSTLEFITNRSQVPRSIERCPGSVPTTISLTRVCMRFAGGLSICPRIWWHRRHFEMARGLPGDGHARR